MRRNSHVQRCWIAKIHPQRIHLNFSVSMVDFLKSSSPFSLIFLGLFYFFAPRSCIVFASVGRFNDCCQAVLYCVQTTDFNALESSQADVLLDWQKL